MVFLLKHIPGFRSKSKYKMTIAIIYYLFTLIMLSDGISLFLAMISLPFIFFSFICILKTKKIFSEAVRVKGSERIIVNKAILKFICCIIFFIIAISNVDSVKTTNVTTNNIQQKSVIKSEAKKSNPNPVLEKKNTNTILELKFIPTIKIEDGKCMVNVETNLPNDTEIMIGLSNRDIVSKKLGLPEDSQKYTDEQLIELVESSYDGSCIVKVLDGKAESEWFNNDNNRLDKSKYELSVSMSIVKLQPASVQKILGVKGKNLTGKYVEKNKELDDKFINYTETVEIE